MDGFGFVKVGVLVDAVGDVGFGEGHGKGVRSLVILDFYVFFENFEGDLIIILIFCPGSLIVMRLLILRG